ncbi:MAG: prolyl oligopeptidase family serine peptidase [Bacteroidia bacterium]
MNYRIICLLSATLTGYAFAFSQDASGLKPLGHEVYNFWQTLDNAQISANGNRVLWEENPQKGDNWLYVLELTSGRKDSFPRSSQAVFSPEEDFIAFRIKPHEDSVRKAKLAKKKEDQMPKDSLGIWVFAQNTLYKVPQLQSFQLPLDAGSWIAYMVKPEKPVVPQDSTAADSAKKEKPAEKKTKGNLLVIENPLAGLKFSYESAEEFVMSEAGSTIGFTQVSGDSIDSVAVRIFDTDLKKDSLLWIGDGKAAKPSLDPSGQKFAVLITRDTGEVKVYDMYYSFQKSRLKAVVDTHTSGMPEGWAVSTNGNVKFSPSGEKIWIGTAPIPPAPVKDTIPDDEKAKVDVWNWKDARLQPQQLAELDADKKKTYTAVWHIEKQQFVQIASPEVDAVFLQQEGDDQRVYGFAQKPYQRESSWESPDSKDVYVIDVATGERERVLERQQYASRLSPDGKFMIWYEPSDQEWHVYSLEKKNRISLTHGLKVAFYDEKNDVPMPAYPYGIEGFVEDAPFVLIKDRFDLWKCDLTGETKPVNLTGKYGRKNAIRFDYIDTDRENPFLEKESILLKGTSEDDQSEGFYQLSMTGKFEMKLLHSDAANFRDVAKAKSAETLIWTRRTFTDNPDLYVSGSDFSNQKKLTAINPWQKEYRWGNVQSVEWKTPEGKKLKGLLYTPQDLNPARKYPMLVYFYEVLSDRRYWYFAPSPSRSTINPSYYTSNEYIVFYPDIEYTEGQPGEDAFDAVISGTQYLLDHFEYIDKDRIALQGQSWGGYQVAYIVTKTNMFRAAMAGAPVSNMTSAYGGIRWETGISRMFQYERTQSRLGTTLWENPSRYLENSPLFSVPQIQTPLLIMHNDADGAVPWYQGIELFNALRRLDKPAWMLVYNGEKHNLTRWPNRVDLSIRMQQFFDYYLKDAPIPSWMETGVPALEKGINTGYQVRGKE